MDIVRNYNHVYKFSSEYLCGCDWMLQSEETCISGAVP